MNKSKKLFVWLSDGSWRSSINLQQWVVTLAIGSMVADLRKKGCVIESRYAGRSSTGAMIYDYRMRSFPSDIKFRTKGGD